MAAESTNCRRYKLDYIGNISKFSILRIRDRFKTPNVRKFLKTLSGKSRKKSHIDEYEL